MVSQAATTNPSKTATQSAVRSDDKSSTVSSTGDALKNLSTTAEKLLSAPDLQNKLVPRAVATPTATETILARQTPLNQLLSDGAPAAQITFDTASNAELGRGSQGPAVQQLQQKLSDLGYNAGPADANFGPRTANALNSYQQDRIESLQSTLAGVPPPSARAVLNNQIAQLSLEQSRGVAGSMTQQQLDIPAAGQVPNQQPVPSVDPTISPASGLGVGQTGADVKSLQRELQRAGFSPGTADGNFGGRTLGAVQTFQRERVAALDVHLSGSLPPRERSQFQTQRGTLQSELDSNVAGAETRSQLRQVISASVPADIPINTNLQVNNEGFINNDPRIVTNRVPDLERSAFSDPVGDIENVVLHRTVTDTADQALTSFGTPRDGVHYGTHFLIGRDGTIQQTASLNNRTNHVRGHNSSSVGIEVVGMPLDAAGNQTIGPPQGNPVVSWETLTPKQTESVAYLTNSLNSHYGLGTDTVEVHEDLDAKTAGEGATVYNAIESLLAP